MGLGSALGKIKKVLTVITDLLLIGRGKGWWSKKPGPIFVIDARKKEK